MATFPDVPNVPGVPQLPWDGPPPAVPAALSQQQSNALYPVPAKGSRSMWGLYDSAGNPVAVTGTGNQSFNAMAYTGQSTIPTYQVERGSFGSYNKVQQPYRAPIRLCCGGDASTRQAFLLAIERAKQSLDLYSIVTPEVTLTNANVTGYAYRREARDGAHMLKVELHVEEVRVVQAAYTTTTKQPDGASPQSGGKVQPQPPTKPQQSALFQLKQYIMSLGAH